MNPLQAWLLIGIPCLALAAAMFLRRSTWRSAIGYVALLGGFGGLAANHRLSAGVFGGLCALVYAAGRGGSLEHTDRRENELAVPDEALLPSRRTPSSA